MSELIICEKKDNVAILKVNRPKALNALSREVVDEMDTIIDGIAADKDIRVLIITGDKNFAAGADISKMVELSPEEAKGFLFSKTFNKIESLGIPTIAAVCGYALGGGLELALTCDFRIASEDAQVGLPEINLGIMPGAGGTMRLPRLIGEARAKEMIMLGGTVKADQALSYGIVTKVVPTETLMDEAMAMAQKLIKKAPLALKAAKEAIAVGTDRSAEIEQEAIIWSNLFATEDQREGMRAFIDKRKPQYQGK